MNDTTKRNTAITATIEFGSRGQFSAKHSMESCDSAALTLKFSHGEELIITTNSLDNGLLYMAAVHGLKQKLVDAAAISRNPETGRAATVEDKYQAVKAVYDRLLSGQWNATREGGVTGGLLLQALCRMYEGRKTPDELKAFLADKTDAEKTALRKNPRVAAIIEEIRAEQGKAANIDTDELLGELDEDEGESEQGEREHIDD